MTGSLGCRAWRTVARLPAAAVAALCGCAPPSVDVLVSWVEGRDDGEGNRTLQIYDRGARLSASIEPNVPGSGVELLSLEVDNRGRGIAVSGDSITEHIGVLDGRQPRLTSAAAGGGKLEARFGLARNGDAVIRGFDRESVPAVAFMPTSSRYAGEVELIQAPSGLAGGSWLLTQASDAPILAWVEGSGFPVRPFGRVVVMAYPSSNGAALSNVEQVTELAQGALQGRGLIAGAVEGRVSDGWCPDRVCMAPGGGSLTTLGEEVCQVNWWSWTDAEDAQAVEATTVQLDEGCPVGTDPWLFAQIEDDVVLLDDNDRIYVADLSTGTVQAGPKLSGAPLAMSMGGGFGVRIVDRGHAVVFVSSDARMVRADASGVRIVSAESAPCPTSVLAVTSPSGQWMLATCNGDGTFVPADQGAVYRVSSLGLEIYNGITLAPLAIDDEGDALLYSFDPDDGEPRGLFVLGSDGQLARIDGLEPEPDQIRDSALIGRWFAAQSLGPGYVPRVGAVRG